MKADRPTQPERRAPLLHGVDWAVQAGVADEVMQGTRARVRRRRRRQLATASALVVMAMVGATWHLSVRHETEPRAARSIVPARDVTAVAWAPERRILPDGSIVELRSGAEIEVDYTAAHRRVALRRGEAHFQVGRDDHKPFIVSAGGVEARAVGTAFSVQLGQSSVEVLVTAGRVSVDKMNAVPVRPATTAPPAHVAMLEAGNRVVVEVDDAGLTARSAVQALTAAEVEQCLAWRIPKLEFTRTPLSEAIRLVREHSNTRLRLDDPRIGEVRISGILRADNVDTLLRLLAAEHGIKAEPQPSGEILLTARR